MKTIIITTLLVAISILGNAQTKAKRHRYFIINYSYTLKSGCNGEASQTQDITDGKSFSWDSFYKLSSDWIKPNRFYSIEITSLKEVKDKKLMIKKSDKFNCTSNQQTIFYPTTLFRTPQIDTLGFYIKTADLDLRPSIMIECFKDSTNSKVRLMKVYINRKKITWTSDSTFIFKITP